MCLSRVTETYDPPIPSKIGYKYYMRDWKTERLHSIWYDFSENGHTIGETLQQDHGRYILSSHGGEYAPGYHCYATLASARRVSAHGNDILVKVEMQDVHTKGIQNDVYANHLWYWRIWVDVDQRVCYICNRIKLLEEV